jgi:hypothetical protein
MRCNGAVLVYVEADIECAETPTQQRERETQVHDGFAAIRDAKCSLIAALTVFVHAVHSSNVMPKDGPTRPKGLVRITGPCSSSPTLAVGGPSGV